MAVESEALAAIGYDASSRTLFVRFTEGGLYAYFDVPEDAYAGLAAAPSKGHAFQAQVEPRFRYVRLT